MRRVPTRHVGLRNLLGRVDDRAGDHVTETSRQSAVIGIALSGGGLRAAAFGLGALQALDGATGALRGPRSADFLAAVSGGSYTASAISLYVSSDHDLPTIGQLRPFAPGSPEAEHIVNNCGYLTRGGRARFAVALVTTILKGVVVSAGVLLWPAIIVGMASAITVLDSGLAATRVEALVCLLVWVIGLRAVVLGLGIHRWQVVLCGTALTVLSRPLALTANVNAPTRSPHWLIAHPAFLVLAAVAFGVLGAWKAVCDRTTRRSPKLVIRAARTETAFRLIQALLLLAMFWLISVVHAGARNTGVAVIAVAGLVTYGFVAGNSAADMLSTFHFYRNHLVTCFSLVRGAGGPVCPQDPHAVKLSDLLPSDDPCRRQPELLICATANLTRPRGVCPQTGAVSFVMSPSKVTLHLGAGSEVSTHSFERFRLPADLNNRKKESLGLSAAVALSGAAASPAMGKMTMRSLQTIFTVLNVRLGRWVPNIAHIAIREALAVNERPLDVGFDARDLMCEALGVHLLGSSLIYISDGGHYDNLGVVELLRRQCEHIICVDSSADPIGVPTTLNQTIDLAQSELNATVEIDVTRFARSELGSRMVRHTFAVGSVTYADQTTAQIIVIKIGLSLATSHGVRELRDRWRRFPYHGTGDQFYNPRKFDAYRALGFDSAHAALQDPRVVDACQSVGWLT